MTWPVAAAGAIAYTLSASCLSSPWQLLHGHYAISSSSHVEKQVAQPRTGALGVPVLRLSAAFARAAILASRLD